MNQEELPHQELRRLLDCHLANQLDEAHVDRLVQILSADESARRLYLEYTSMNAALYWSMECREGLRLIADGATSIGVLGVIQCQSAGQLWIADSAIADTGTAGQTPLTCLGDDHGGLDSALGNLFTRWTAFSVGATAFSVGATAVTSLIVAGIVFVLAFARNPGSEPLRPVAELAYGKVNSVQLESGVTTLTLDGVGTVVVEGPAEFALLSPRRARLTRGRIRMHVTEPTGQGFVVETPNGDVTDLGTEFGIDVSSNSDTGVVVFQGTVDLAISSSDNGADRRRVERLVQGEGVRVNGAGQLGRIMSVVTGQLATFRASGDEAASKADRVIGHVADNIRGGRIRNFYELVPAGLKEDALAYADRPEHDWNGVDHRGMPAYLIGADYVKTFNDDKMRSDVVIQVTLIRPARLFVLLDDRVSPPEWLRRDFRDTGDDIGLDAGAYAINGLLYTFERAIGPGQSIDAQFSVWERVVHESGVVLLGPNLGASGHTGMYGIAAVAIEHEAASAAEPLLAQSAAPNNNGENGSAK